MAKAAEAAVRAAVVAEEPSRAEEDVAAQVAEEPFKGEGSGGSKGGHGGNYRAPRATHLALAGATTRAN